MSGICGICDQDRASRLEGISAMLAGVAARGEERFAQVDSGLATLGVASRWDFQQVASIPGVKIAADLELFNAGEIAALLGLQEEDFKRSSIAERVAELYQRKGPDFVKHLDGVFSIAIWDENAQRLVLAIDRLGVNSLYWHQSPQHFLFSTRVGGIRAMLNGAAKINPPAMMQYLLYSAVPAPLSIYKNVEKLRPGHLLIWKNGRVTHHAYWDLEFPEERGMDESYWANEVRETMRSATFRQVRECPPGRTGAYLSGGTDSSSVVAFLSECQPPAKSFSIFFSEDRYNEISYARIAAKRFGALHSELCLEPKHALEALPLLTGYYDEPFANSSAIGGYFCARFARENGVDTLLAGDGGDELFAGNERYAMDKRFALYHNIPSFFRSWLIEPASNLLSLESSRFSLPRRYIRRARIPNPRRIFSYGFFLSTPPQDVFAPGFLETAPPAHWMDVAEGHFQTSKHRTELNRLLYLDVKMTLADNDLRKVLGTAELAGVRARFPLLDYRLAELSGRIPARLKLKGFRKRYIFKEAMKGILPEEIIHKKKHGFGVPVALWFLHEPRLRALVEDVLSDSRTRQRGYFQPAFYDRIIQLHRTEDAKNYGELLWYLLVLELWHREHLERSPAGKDSRYAVCL